MRLFVVGLIAALGLSASARADSEAVGVTSTVIDRFDLKTPVGARYDRLVFLGGLQLRSNDPDFGGLSGLRLSADGARFTAISDRGAWYRGELSYDGSRLTGASNLTKRLTPGRDGKPLPGRKGFDTEALEIQGRTAWTAAERVNWLTRYALDADGDPEGRGVAVAIPAVARKAPFNQGYEALAATSSGALVMIAEKYLDENGENRAFVVGGKAPFAFAVRRTDDFSPTDLARLPGGDFVLLERRYKPPFSLAVRIRRLDAKDLRPDAVVDGPVLMEAAFGAQTIDNFEATSVHEAGGRTVITILADDNFSFLERILMMQFALPD